MDEHQWFEIGERIVCEALAGRNDVAILTGLVASTATNLYRTGRG